MVFSKISGMTLRSTGKSKSIVQFAVTGAPTNLSASSANPGIIDLVWTAPSLIPGAPAITSYTISITGATTTTINTGNTNTSYSWTGGVKGSSYTFTVTANNVGGSGSPSTPATAVCSGNLATGGTTADVVNYNGTGQTWRTHTFTSGGSLSVSVSTVPFNVLVVGGGAGGGSNHDGAGGSNGYTPWGGLGGGVINGSYTISTGSHTVTVGIGGGAQGNLNGTPPYNGGTSSIGTVAVTSGGNATVNGIQSSISGTAKWYAGQGAYTSNYNSSAGGGTQGILYAPYNFVMGTAGTANTGGGGGSGTWSSGPHSEPASSFGGGSGIVIVAYRIS